MIDSIFKILGAGLSIWESKEKTKYLDKYLELKRDYYEELNKDMCDDAVLDHIEHELLILGEAFSTKAPK